MKKMRNHRIRIIFLCVLICILGIVVISHYQFLHNLVFERKVDQQGTIEHERIAIFNSGNANAGKYEYDLGSNVGINEFADLYSFKDVVMEDDLEELLPDDSIVGKDPVYLTPEMFGAVGDGYADDSEPLQACIDAAVVGDKTIPVRGFGSYNIIQGLKIRGENLDIFLNQINYMGTDAAITFTARWSKFCFGRVYARQKNATALYFTGNIVNGYRRGFDLNKVICHRIWSDGNAVVLDSSFASCYYNTFEFQWIKSENANGIYIIGSAVAENDIYGKVPNIQKGYLLVGGDQSIRLHQFALEHSVKNGVRGNATLIDCRTVEMQDNKTPSNMDAGNVYDFTDVLPVAEFQNSDSASGTIDMLCINAENALTYENTLSMVKKAFEDGATWSDAWSNIGVNARPYARIEGARRVCSNQFSGVQTFLPPGEFIVYHQHVAYKPYADWHYSVDESEMHIEMSSENNYQYITPTVFDINATSSDIFLDYSYCCFAINRFKIIQHTGKTARIFDKLGNMIFDGTNNGAGVYTFTCSFVPLDEIVIRLDDGTEKRCPENYLRRVYTDENERWTISKEELIEE